MKINAELGQWEAVYYRGLSGTVNATLSNNKDLWVSVGLSQSSRMSRERTCVVSLIGDSFQAPSATGAFAELLFWRLPGDPDRSRGVLRMDAEVKAETAEGTLWMAKAPDVLGTCTLVAEVNGQVLRSGTVVVRPKPDLVVDTNGDLKIETRFVELRPGRRTSAVLGDSVGVPIPLELLGKSNRLRWFSR